MMKKNLLALLLMPMMAFAAGTVTGVTARQRYPWNGLVDIAVTIQGTAEDVSVCECLFAATNGATKEEIPVTHVSRNGEDVDSGSTWTRKFIWDAKADVGAVKIDDIALVVDTFEGVQLWENGPYWATCNVGATKPEEYGYYFWWGDTVGYKRNASNNGWISVKNSTSYSFSTGNCPTYGKDNSQLRSAGYIDATGNLVAAHDAATAHLGSPWRIPTDEEITALINNCDTELTTRNGVSGRLVKGRGAYASKSIFLPVAGYGYDSRLENLGSIGFYWSSTPNSPDSLNSNFAWILCFNSGGFIRNYYHYRDVGHSVRPPRGFATVGVALCAATTHLSFDCREGAKVADSKHPLVYDASWYEGGVTAKITANGQEIVSGTSGVCAWMPSADGVYLLKLNVYNDSDEVVGTEQVLYLSREGLTDLVIPEGMTEIGEYEFADGKFASITIPPSVTSIGADAFVGCENLKRVDVATLEDWLNIEFANAAANPLNCGAALYVGGKKVTELVIPTGRSAIGDYAVFGGRFTSVAIPSSVMNIGDAAFAGCSDVMSVMIPKCVTKLSATFPDAYTKIQEVVLADDVVSIGNQMFSGCSGMSSVTFPSSVVGIGINAFEGCSGLTSIGIPSSVTSIGADAFVGCENLKRVDVATLEDWLNIEFANAAANPLNCGAALYVGGKEVTELVVPAGTTEIGEYAFAGGQFMSVAIPDSVTKIAPTAFAGCLNVENVVLPLDFKMHGSAGVQGLLPDSYKNVKSVVLIGTGNEVPDEFLKGCTALESVTIPDCVTSIAPTAFAECPNIVEVSVSDGLRVDTIEQRERLPEVSGDWAQESDDTYRSRTIGHSQSSQMKATVKVDESCEYVFQWKVSSESSYDWLSYSVDGNGQSGRISGNKDWQSVKVPLSAGTHEIVWTYAKDYVGTSGSDCGWVKLGTVNETVAVSYTKTLADIFPDSVAGIERATVGSRDGCIHGRFFSGCASLKSVVVADAVRRIDAGAFDDCTALESVVFPSELKDFGLDLIPEAMRGSLGYDDDGFMIKDGWLLDYKEKGASEVVVPEGVIGIGHFALAYMADLERVSLPSTLKYIASAAFVEDTYLDDVAIPDSVEYIGKDAFLRCSWVQSLTFGAGVREIADRAFAGCTKLVEAELPEGLGEIGDSAFSNCWRMASVSLPLSVSNVAATAFRDCASLTDVTVSTMAVPMSDWFAPVYRRIEHVTVPTGMTEVRAEMFAGCVALKAVELPEGVANLASGAFRDCAALEAIRLPESLETVGDEAFAGCVALKSVVLPKKVDVLGKRVFSGCAALSDVRLPRRLTAIPDETFIGCDALALFVVPETVTALGSRIVSSATTAIYYLGNAPAYAADAYAQANASLVSYVVDGTRGWDGLPTSRDLPQGWPASNARAITTWAPDQCVIRFHANDGTDATTDQPFTYGAPVTLAKSGFVRAGYSMSGWATSAKGEVVYADGETLEEMSTVPAGVVHLYAVWEDATVEMPVVVPGDGAIFKSETCTVTIACGTEGAAVYYRVGAAPKASSKFLYSAPFEISETSTIYTYALKDGTSSATNVVMITKGHVLTFVEAASAEGITAFALGGDAEWTAEEDANAKVGNASVRSGEIDDDQISWFTAEVEGPGTLSFWWKASCEEDELQDFDHLVFAVDDVVEGEVARLDGITAWERISTTIPAGSHTLYWAYVKDESDFDGEDCGWVDGIVWAPSGSQAVAPTIEGDEGATVTGDAETGFVVKPSEGKTAVEVTIPQGVDAAKVTVEVSVKVASVKPNGAKVKIVSGGTDITEFLNVPAADGNGVVDLTKAAVKEEIVKEAMDVEKGAEIKLNAADPKLKTAPTRVGLFYQLREGGTLGGMKDGDSKVGDGEAWMPKITVKGGNSAFYSIGVGKGE